MRGVVGQLVATGTALTADRKLPRWVFCIPWHPMENWHNMAILARQKVFLTAIAPIVCQKNRQTENYLDGFSVFLRIPRRTSGIPRHTQAYPGVPQAYPGVPRRT